MRLVSFAEMAGALDDLAAARGRRLEGTWTLYQVLVHVAQGIEYSMSGYPSMRSAVFRKTVGRLALRKFLGQGYLSHDLAAPIPGAPDIPPDGQLDEGFARLRKAMADFGALNGDPAPHFAYGPLTKLEYEQVHAMHLANHLG
jgi:hypothetical protein